MKAGAQGKGFLPRPPQVQPGHCCGQPHGDRNKSRKLKARQRAQRGGAETSHHRGSGQIPDRPLGEPGPAWATRQRQTLSPTIHPTARASLQGTLLTPRPVDDRLHPASPTAWSPEILSLPPPASHPGQA